ncbi:MAG TPA: glycosyltransferase family 39 protein [Chthonomonadaceae bacterium]|nr:glycosyltransferase family 39 protein [Chthonomonadaceae bacterium]
MVPRTSEIEHRHVVGTHSPAMAAPSAHEADRAALPTALALFLLGALVAALFAFVLYPRQGAIDSIVDLNGFGKLGRHIAAGDGFSLGYGPTLRRAPLYPAFVALVLTLCGNSGPDAVVFRPVLILQCLMVGLSCVIAWALGRKLFGARAGLVAGILCALTPQVWRYVGMTEVETTMGLLIALTALTGLNLYRQPSLGNGLLFGLVVGAATLVKPVALLYPFVFLFGCCWRGQRTKTQAAGSAPRPWLPVAVAIGTFFLCLLPWSLRNRIVTGGRFQGVSSNGAGEFLRGYVNAQPKFALLRQDFGGSNPDSMQWDWEANLYEDALLQQHGMSFFSTERFGPNGEKRPMEARFELELKKDAIEGAEVKRRLREEPLGFVKKFGIQVFTFWYIVETRRKSLLVGAIAFVALSLAAFGWLRARRNGIDTFPVVSVVLYFNLLYAAILAFARYSMPVYPTLLVMSAYGLTQLRSQRRAAAISHDQ